MVGRSTDEHQAHLAGASGIAPGEIEVTLRPAENLVMLIVRDTGAGIPHEELSRLFERFHRVPGAHARTHEGTGIGLALVRELVHLFAGKGANSQPFLVLFSASGHRAVIIGLYPRQGISPHRKYEG